MNAAITPMSGTIFSSIWRLVLRTAMPITMAEIAQNSSEIGTLRKRSAACSAGSRPPVTGAVATERKGMGRGLRRCVVRYGAC